MVGLYFHRLGSFLRELKRRKVYRVAAVYAAVAFVVWQVAEIAVQALLPGWVLTLVVVLSLVAFPVVVVLAWAFDLTPRGVERTDVGRGSPHLPAEHATLRDRRVLGLFAAGVGAGVLVWAASVVYEAAATADPVPEIRSLVVLPLENLSADPDQEYFTAGMHEALITELGQISALTVISRTSAMHYQGTDQRPPVIARELGVDALLEGSVLQARDRVRITLTLVHGHTDKQLWSESYVRELRDILLLQSEVATAIAEEIQLVLAPEDKARLASARVVDPGAHSLYLRANHEVGKGTEAAFQAARQLYQQAIAADSSFAPAYAGLAMAYIELGSWMASLPPGAVYTRARAAALQALERDSTLAEAHFALGRIQHLFEWDWAGADSSFRRGMELNPGSTHARLAYANYLFSMGRFEEAMANARRLVESDPLSPSTFSTLGWALRKLGHDAEALVAYRKALELPHHPWAPHVGLAEWHLERDQTDSAYSYAATAERGVGSEGSPTLLALLGHVYARTNHRADALRILSDLEARAENGYVPPNALAVLHIGLGNEETALELVEEGFEVRDVTSVFHKVRWLWDPLRDEPRFQAVLRQMDFPDS